MKGEIVLFNVLPSKGNTSCAFTCKFFNSFAFVLLVTKGIVLEAIKTTNSIKTASKTFLHVDFSRLALASLQ
jgi:hypothetical protein